MATVAVLAALALGALPRGVGAMPLMTSAGLSADAANVSLVQDAAYVCHRWRHGWRACWWAHYGPNWPPTWRGSGWRGPGWYGWGWRKEYFRGYASRP